MARFGPAYYLMRIVIVVFLSETFAMYLLHLLNIHDYLAELLLDGIMLVLILLPFLYWYVYSPLHREITKSSKIQKELENSNRELNEYVKNVVYNSEYQYRQLFDSHPCPMWVYDLETLSFIAVNDAAVRHYGYSTEEFLSMTIRDIRPPEDIPRLLENTKRVTSGLDNAGVWRHIKKDGTVISVEITSHTLNFRDRRAETVMAVDITERIKTEEFAKAEKDRAQQYLDIAGVMIVAIDSKQLVTLINKKGCEILGYEAGDVIGKNWFDNFIPARIRDEMKAIFERLMSGDIVPVEYYENPVLQSNGDEGIIAWHNVVLKDTNGKINGTLSSGSDITERKKTEELLYQSQREWENTFNTINDMITVHDKDFSIIRANKAAEKILGLPFLEKTPDSKCFKYYHGTDEPPEGCPSCQCLTTGIPATFEIFEPHLNMFIEIRAIPRFDSDNLLTGLIHVVRDITERKKNEEHLNRLLHDISKAKKEWEMTFDGATELMMLIDKDLTLIRSNKSLADFVGITVHDLIGRKCSDIFPCIPDQTGFCMDRIWSEEPAEWTEVRTTTGHWLYVSHRPVFDENNEFLHSVVIASDITSMKNTQVRLTQSEEELQNRVYELEKFYEMAVGRELRMKELKEENRQLKSEISKYERTHGI